MHTSAIDDAPPNKSVVNTGVIEHGGSPFQTAKMDAPSTTSIEATEGILALYFSRMYTVLMVL